MFLADTLRKIREVLKIDRKISQTLVNYTEKQKIVKKKQTELTADSCSLSTLDG